MSKYTATFSVPGVNTASSVIANFKAGTDRPTLLEVGFFVEAAPTANPLLLLQRMAAVGTGAITSVAGVAHDAADTAAAGSVLETAWVTTRPTLTANAILRRFQAQLAIGNGFIWDFTNRPIILPPSGGLALVQSNASGATLGTIGGYFTWDE